MSGTRSHSPKAPAIDALIVAHGQPSAPLPAERALAQLASKVASCLPGRRIGSATLAAPGALELALEELRPGALVFPQFIANGWFVQDVLKSRIAGHQVRLLDPLGTLPGLATLAATALETTFDTEGWDAQEAHVLVAAHGSAKGKAAGLAARRFIRDLSCELPGPGISVGFVEEAPMLSDLVAELPRQTVCLPLLAMAGEHLKEDVTAELRQRGFAGPILPAVGQLPGVPGEIALSLRAGWDRRDAA